jgi:hypothetical protein
MYCRGVLSSCRREAAQCDAGRSGAKRGGAERSGAERSEAGRSGAKRGGAERSGAERSDGARPKGFVEQPELEAVVISGVFFKILLHNHFITEFFFKKIRRCKSRSKFQLFFFAS